MEAIQFNETPDYQYMTVLGISGVYTPHNIDPSTLPDGFYKYNLHQGDGTRFDAISDAASSHEAYDSFITQETISLGDKQTHLLKESDWSFRDEAFDFEGHFGKKLAIDTQIQQAEEKRNKIIEEKSAKRRGKSVYHDSQENEIG